MVNSLSSDHYREQSYSANTAELDRKSHTEPPLEVWKYKSSC